MKEINLPSGNYLFVEVPNDARKFSLSNYKWVGYTVAYFWTAKIQKHHNGTDCLSNELVSFPRGEYEIISTTKDITEEQAESIVEFKTETLYPEGFEPYVTSGYRNYNIPYTEIFSIQRAKKSLQSLIKANGLDVNKNYLILKKL